MASEQRGVRDRSLGPGGGGGGGGTIPTPIPDDVDLPLWGDDFDGSMHYASFIDAFELFSVDRAPGSAAVNIRSGDSASGVGPVNIRTGVGGGATRPAVSFGDRLTSGSVGQKEAMPEVLPRSIGMRFDGIDISPNRQVLATDHQNVPIIAPAVVGPADDPSWLAEPTAGSAAGITVTYSGRGVFIANAAVANGDGVVLRPNTNNPNAWAAFVASSGLSLLTKQGIATPADITTYRAECGCKAVPAVDYGVNSGNGAAAGFFFFDSTFGPNWQAVADDGIGGLTVADTGIAAAPSTTYVFAMFYDGISILAFIDGLLVAAPVIGLATVGRPYVGASSPGVIASRGIEIIGQAVSRNNF